MGFSEKQLSATRQSTITDVLRRRIEYGAGEPLAFRPVRQEICRCNAEHRCQHDQFNVPDGSNLGLNVLNDVPPDIPPFALTMGGKASLGEAPFIPETTELGADDISRMRGHRTEAIRCGQ